MKETVIKQNLRQIFDGLGCLSNKVYISKSFYGTIDKDLRLKASFTSSPKLFDTDKRHVALRLSIINRTIGTIDSNSIWFKDIWDEERIKKLNLDGCPGGNMFVREIDWYEYQPNAEDIRLISEKVSEYISVYQNTEQDVGKMQGM